MRMTRVYIRYFVVFVRKLQFCRDLFQVFFLFLQFKGQLESQHGIRYLTDLLCLQLLLQRLFS